MFLYAVVICLMALSRAATSERAYAGGALDAGRRLALSGIDTALSECGVEAFAVHFFFAFFFLLIDFSERFGLGERGIELVWRSGSLGIFGSLADHLVRKAVEMDAGSVLHGDVERAG